MIVGEISNFAAYTFAPAILVTPLGALSVLIGAVLAAVFLKEELGALGKAGCSTCLLGSIIIVLHAPPDVDVQTVDEILHYAIQPGFLLYCLIVGVFSVVMIYSVAPKYGKKNPLVYISICSMVGSVSVMAVKGFGIALKLTLAGNNQFTHPSTYVFIIVVVICILTQMNYLNKALDQYSTSIVNPLYYVLFTTATLCASFILFKGFNTTNAVNTISLLCGFLVIFSGVYLLNFTRSQPSDAQFSSIENGIGMEEFPLDNGIGAGVQARRSLQGRSSFGSNFPRRANSFPKQDTAALRAVVAANEDEESLGLTQLDDSDDERQPKRDA